MISYHTDTKGVTPERLVGFFEGWPNPPSPETHLRILEGSDRVVLAVDDETKGVVGFVTAITDGVLAAYVPLLEVLPEYRGRGIGCELALRVLDSLGEYYMVDLVCDPELEGFYEPLGLRPAHAMVVRRRERQSGRPGDPAD